MKKFVSGLSSYSDKKIILINQRCNSSICEEQNNILKLLPIEIQRDVIHVYLWKCNYCNNYWSHKLKICPCCKRILSQTKEIKKRIRVYICIENGCVCMSNM